MTLTASRSELNQAFLRNIYQHGPEQGHAFVLAPEYPRNMLKSYTLNEDPIENWVPYIVEKYKATVEFHEKVGDDGVACADIMTPTQIYAAAFGCPVHEFEGSNPAAMPMITTAVEADELEEPDIWKSPTLHRVFELGQAVLRELGKDAFISSPDYQSGFDIAAQIWEKSSFMCAMMLPGEAEAVKRLTRKCANLLKKFYVALRNEFPTMNPCHCPGNWTPPEMGPWLSDDECGAISPAMFEEFCLPELIDLAETFGGLGMHCCAAAEHQFPSFNKIPNLYGFNRGVTPKGFDPILEHFSGPDSPVHALAWIGDDIIEHLIKEAPAGTRFIFNATCCEDEAQARLEQFRKLSPRTDG